MEPVKDASHLYEVERRATHAARPGFRIQELQISPTQQVPWHYHSNVQDTFYVLAGTSGFSCRTRRRRCGFRPARPIRSDRSAPISSPTRATAPRHFSCCKASASMTSCR